MTVDNLPIIKSFNPLVTVYIVTHNRSGLLKRALDSVRNQTYSNIDIIVINDRSDDDTEVYLQKIKMIDDRIDVVNNHVNLGACESRNIAINKARGVYITGLDDDDFFSKNRIELFVNNIHLLDFYSMVFSEYNIILSQNKSKHVKGLNVVDQWKIIEGNYIGNQVFTLTERLRMLGGFDKEFPAWQDYEMWYRTIMAYGPAKKINHKTYNVDQSHDYERISLGKGGKVKVAFGLFVKKHALSGKDAMFLHLSLYGYSNEVFKLVDYLSYIMNGIFIRSSKVFLSKFIFNVKAKWSFFKK